MLITLFPAVGSWKLTCLQLVYSLCWPPLQKPNASPKPSQRKLFFPPPLSTGWCTSHLIKQFFIFLFFFKARVLVLKRLQATALLCCKCSWDPGNLHVQFTVPWVLYKPMNCHLATEIRVLSVLQEIKTVAVDTRVEMWVVILGLKM